MSVCDYGFMNVCILIYVDKYLVSFGFMANQP